MVGTERVFWSTPPCAFTAQGGDDAVPPPERSDVTISVCSASAVLPQSSANGATYTSLGHTAQVFIFEEDKG